MAFNSCIGKFIAKTPEELNRIFTNRRMTEDAGQFFTFNERIRIENVVCSKFQATRSIEQGFY
jgi:hypothetical protein